MIRHNGSFSTAFSIWADRGASVGRGANVGRRYTKPSAERNSSTKEYGKSAERMKTFGEKGDLYGKKRYFECKKSEKIG